MLRVSSRARLVAIALLLVTGAAGLYLSTQQSEREVVRLPLVTDCKLHLQPCSTLLPEMGELTFEINPKNPSPTDPILLTARFGELSPDRVQVLFEGKEMYMGFLQYEIYPGDNEGEFSGTGSLSTCIRELMEWIALVKVYVGDTIYEVPFEFETLHLK